MTLKKVLAALLVVSLAFFAYYSSAVVDSIGQIIDTVTITRSLIITVCIAVALQLIGHVLRAAKMSLLLSRTKESSVRFQFRALSIGYLFDALLPFRLGELIRARIISSAMSISFSYAFTMVLFERAIDAVLLGVVGVLIILITSHGSLLIYMALALTAVGVGILALIILLIRQNRTLLLSWKYATSWLNDDLKVGFRFKLWSIIYGLQQSLVRPVMTKYLALSVVAWICYGLSALSVVWYFAPGAIASTKALLSLAPYYGVARPAGPANLGAYSSILNQFTQATQFAIDQVLAFNLVMWAILVVPISLVGIVLLFGKTRESLWHKPSRKISRNSLVNKLYRQEDISRDMASFLENFFSNNSLSNIVHRLERSERFRLEKYFKGGSDAITILALQDGQEVVKKIIPLEFEDRLKAQADWLIKFKKVDGIVNVLAEEHAEDYYAIDLDYDPKNQEFYEYIHRNPVYKSQMILDQVFAKLADSVHKRPAAPKTYPDEREEYIKKHILGCLEKAGSVDKNLIKAAAAETIIINDKEYDNLYQILDKIKKHPQAWEDIARYQRTGQVHGDVIVDNLLVHEDTGEPFIIDPAPDGNIINGMVFDFGKIMQSLYCGYETLLRDTDLVELRETNHIDYRDNISGKYSELAEYIRSDLAPRYLTDGEQRAMMFHAGALFIRRLKHQVTYTPANALKLYAVGVKTLNDFLAQYDQTDLL